MVRESSCRNVEELSCYIFGINSENKVMVIAVYVKGRSVRLSGPHGSHAVHPSNIGGIDGWKREATLVWHLSNTVDVPRALLNSAFEKSKREELERIAADPKRQAVERK